MIARTPPLARSLAIFVAFCALMAIGAPAPAAAACDHSYCQRGGCVSSAVIRDQARRQFRGWKILSVRLVPGGPPPSCLLYEVRLRRGAEGRIARFHVNGRRA